MPQRRRQSSTLCSFILFLLLPLLVLSSGSAVTNSFYIECSTYSRCGDLYITYPFRRTDSPEYCGYPGYELNCNSPDDNPNLTIYLKEKEYNVQKIDKGILTVVDPNIVGGGGQCPRRFTNTSINSTLFDYTHDKNLTVYINCSFPKPLDLSEITCLKNTDEQKYSYYKVHDGPSGFLEDLPLGSVCDQTAATAIYETAANFLNGSLNGFREALSEGFGLRWTLDTQWCQKCIDSDGICGYNKTTPKDPTCFCSNETALSYCRYNTSVASSSSSSKDGLIIGVSIAGGVIVALCCSFCFLLYYRRNKRTSSSLLDRIVSLHPSSKSDPELASSIHAPIFTYDQLYAATNGFDASNELGDGGFGTVYKGKLQDGRLVAVKRLYENSFRRVEQFMNEVKILSFLRHQYLVTLYGCTSRLSRELLLVYEFVPNGTVADHLHGSLSSESFMPWEVRMSIAIETADALNYLHSVEPQIIHRDVKTNNILLDNSFHVKVADFGLSRLFPLDATHVSTAPQGTPGYVDPDYHQCYQLTDKSDVYSFGVVLMELISSKPAVDITRQRNEINLATMAINKIQRQELHEFVDLRLGYQSDSDTNRMITQVAELAFQCLQSDKDMRPCIKDVLEILEGIQTGGCEKEYFRKEDATVKEEARPLKSSPPYSPNSVTEGWVSRTTTPNTSG